MTKKKIDLNKLSFEELKKEVQNLEKKKENIPTKMVGVWKIGKAYFIRTVTLYFLGKLVNVTDNELVMANTSWISDCGRFHKFVKGEFDNNVEIEPYPSDKEIIIGRGSIIDSMVWEHELPNKVK